MKQTNQIKHRALLLATSILALGLSTQMRADTGACGGASTTLPFTDVPSGNIFFCAIASAYFAGLMDGTSTTTYNPVHNVTREEMAEAVSRTLDQSLRRGGQRAALDQWWTPALIPTTAKTLVGQSPVAVKSDGADLWVANKQPSTTGTVSRVRASDGKLLGTWTIGGFPVDLLVARGRIYVVAYVPPPPSGPPDPQPGRLFNIDPTQAPGAATLLTSELGNNPRGIAYDGSRIWTANASNISIYKFICVPGSCVTTVTTGFSTLEGILYDGSHIWVTDHDFTGDGAALKKLNADGSVAMSLLMGNSPRRPIFDGTNIWVPNSGSNSITVVRIKDALGNALTQPFVLATLTGNGLNSPNSAAFDGQRILVTNQGGDSVSLWNAMNLTPLGFFPTGTSQPTGACSDGLNFWITLSGTNQLARF